MTDQAVDQYDVMDLIAEGQQQAHDAASIEHIADYGRVQGMTATVEAAVEGLADVNDWASLVATRNPQSEADVLKYARELVAVHQAVAQGGTIEDARARLQSSDQGGTAPSHPGPASTDGYTDQQRAELRKELRGILDAGRAGNEGAMSALTNFRRAHPSIRDRDENPVDKWTTPTAPAQAAPDPARVTEYQTKRDALVEQARAGSRIVKERAGVELLALKRNYSDVTTRRR